MPLELTEQQRQLLSEQNGSPVEFIDTHTNRVYVLLAREQFEKVRPLLPPPAGTADPAIAEGIRLSRAALRRDLPELLRQPKLRGLWVAYHRDERIGTARKKAPLIREILRRGLTDDEWYIGMIDEEEFIEEIELDAPPPFLMADAVHDEIELY